MNHPLLRHHRRLLQRRERALVALEGAKLLSEAVAAGAALRWLIVTERALARHGGLLEPLIARVPFVVVPEETLKELADTETPQGIVAAAEPVERPLDLAQATLIVALEGVQDPGNVGTILRAAYAAAADGVLIGKGTVDPLNPKVVRSSAAAVLRVPWRRDAELRLPERFLRLDAVPRGGAAPADLDLKGPVAFVFGNEGQGLSETKGTLVTVPMPGGAESLNVAMAAGICLYEAVRQRSKPML